MPLPFSDQQLEAWLKTIVPNIPLNVELWGQIRKVTGKFKNYPEMARLPSIEDDHGQVVSLAVLWYPKSSGYGLSWLGQ